MSDTECYRILGLSSAADRNELRERYRELMAQYHPDKVASLGTELQELAARKTKEINEAYQTLRNRGKA